MTELTQQQKEWIEQYAMNVRHKLQQGDSRFMSAMDTNDEPYTSESAEAIKFYEATDAVEKTDRLGNTPIMSIGRDNVWVQPTEWEWATLLDRSDLAKTNLTDPTSRLTAAGVKGMRRYFDVNLAVPAFFGAMKTGKRGQGTTNYPTSSQDVANTVGSTTGMNVAKLLAVDELFLAAEVELDEDEKYIALTSRQIKELMDDEKFASKDYRDTAVFERRGMHQALTGFLGFNIIHSEKLGLKSTDRACPAWVKSGMYCGKWAEMRVEVTPRADKRNNQQIYIWQMAGVTRTENEKVVRVLCDNT